MKLLSLRGRNIGLLKGDFEFEFDDALTVITGPIGCGKSTILTMIRASLTNAFPGSASSWASWGTPPQEACYFVASWRIGDKTLHIAKCVSGDKKFSGLNIPRLRIEHADGKVEDVFASKEALERTHSLIPVPASIIDGHLIVDQDSITAPVASTPAKFKEIIHTLTRTDELEDMRSQIKDVLLSVTVPDVEVPLQEAKADLNLLQGENNRLQEDISVLMQSYVGLDMDSVCARLDVLDKLKKNDERRTQLEQRRSTALSALRQLESQLKVQEGHLESLKAQHEAGKAQAEAARRDLYSADALLAANRRRDALKAKAEQLAGELQACILSEPYAPPQERPYAGAESEMSDRVALLRQEHAMQAKRLTLVDQGKCPECGTSTELCGHDRDKLEAEVQGLAQAQVQAASALESIRGLNKAWDDYNSAKDSYETCVKTTMSRATEVSKELDELADLPPMTAEIRQELSKVASAFDMLERSVSSSENSLSALKGHIRSQGDMLQSLDTELASIPEARHDANEHARLSKIHGDGLEIKAKVNKLDGSLDSVAKSLERAKQRVQAQEQRAASVKPIRSFRTVLEKASAALAKDGLPRLLSLQYMQKLNERLAFYLETIHADFSAFIDDNLEFMARKSDGLVHHARRLSGGQKQQASVCYLLAVNDVFASTLGVLALDEPSGAMQESNSQDLAEAFNYLAKMGQSTGRQFIVITHSSALAALGCKNISLEGSE